MLPFLMTKAGMRTLGTFISLHPKNVLQTMRHATLMQIILYSSLHFAGFTFSSFLIALPFCILQNKSSEAFTKAQPQTAFVLQVFSSFLPRRIHTHAHTRLHMQANTRTNNPPSPITSENKTVLFRVVFTSPALRSQCNTVGRYYSELPFHLPALSSFSFPFLPAFPYVLPFTSSLSYFTPLCLLSRSSNLSVTQPQGSSLESLVSVASVRGSRGGRKGRTCLVKYLCVVKFSL